MHIHRAKAPLTGIFLLILWLTLSATAMAQGNPTVQLFKAAKAGNMKEAQKVLQAGADINARLKNGMTPLMVATLSGHARLAVYLIEEGAFVNAINENGSTVLMYAAWKGHRSVVRKALDMGAYARAKNKKGWTAILFAEQYGHKEIAEMLRYAEINPNNAEPVKDVAAAIMKFAFDRGKVRQSYKFNEKTSDSNVYRPVTVIILKNPVSFKEITARFGPPESVEEGHLMGPQLEFGQRDLSKLTCKIYRYLYAGLLVRDGDVMEIKGSFKVEDFR